MPSLICLWEGRCNDRRKQAELITAIQELAELNRARWEGVEIPRPDFLSIPREEQERQARETAVVRLFDGPIGGRIAIEPRLATFEELQPAESTSETPAEATVDGQNDKRQSSCLAYSSEQQRWLTFVPPNVELNGVDFRLYDPRQLYPNEDRVSFLFVCCPQWPALDGKLVAAENHVQCQSYEDESIRSSDWLLSRPSVHLRYYLEEWSDRLLSWVKYFFIDDLYYWRSESMSQYDSFKNLMEALCDHHGIEAAKRIAFESVIDLFETEADQWSEQVMRMTLDELSPNRIEIGESALAEEDIEESNAGEIGFEGVDADDEIRCGNCGPYRPPSRDEHPRHRLREIKRLVKESADEALPELWSALHDPDWEPYRNSLLIEVKELGERGLPLAQEVVKFLDGRTHQVPEITIAAYALAAMGPEADEVVHRWMNDTPRSAWEFGPATFLYAIGRDRCVEFWRMALRSQHGDRMLWACNSIATELLQPREELVSDVVDVLSRSAQDPWLRKAAINTLAEIGQPALQAMWELTELGSAYLRAAGLEALGNYAASDPLRPVPTLAIGDREPLVRFQEYLYDPEPQVRVAAAVALQKLAVAMSNERLAYEMNTNGIEVQIAIAEGYRDCIVYQTADKSLRDLIHQRICEPTRYSSQLRRMAAVDLVLSPDVWPTASSPLYAGLQDWHDPYRAEYLEAIRLAGPRCKALLPGIIMNTAGEPPIQLAALRALASMNDEVSEEAVDRTIICLESSNHAVRKEAARTLGEYGLIRVRETIVALRKALIDESRAIASEACEALGKKKKLAADAIPEIVQRFWQLGSIGIEALGRIGTDEAKAEIYAIYKRHENGTQEDDQWIREETRAWLERWLILSPTVVIGTPDENANKNQDASDGSQST